MIIKVDFKLHFFAVKLLIPLRYFNCNKIKQNTGNSKIIRKIKIVKVIFFIKY